MPRDTQPLLSGRGNGSTPGPNPYYSPSQRARRFIRKFSVRPGTEFWNLVDNTTSDRRGLVIMTYVAYVAVAAMSKIFLKRVNDRMQNYTGVRWTSRFRN